MDDLLFFNEYVWLNSQSVQAQMRTVRLLITAICLLVALLAGITLKNWITPLAAALFAIIFFTLTLKKTFLKGSRKGAQKLYQESEDKDMIGPHELETTQEHLLARSQVCESRLQWRGVDKIVETPTHILIFIASVKAYIINRNTVTKGDLNVFLEEAKNFHQRHKSNQLPPPIPFVQ